MIRQQRNVIAQEFQTFAVTVGVTPTPVAQQLNLASLITTVVFSLATAAANVVFLGGPSVSLTNGIEIAQGAPQQYEIIQTRELVELESPLLDLVAGLQCGQAFSNDVPFIAWDLSQMYLIAVAPTNLVIGTFREMWM